MTIWKLMNYAAWAVSALIYFWMIRDFLKTNRECSEDVLFGTYTETDIDVSGEGGQD